jgi:hypothetical protein
VAAAGTDPGALVPTGAYGSSTQGTPPVVATQKFSIYAQNCFGGDTKEGGIYGDATLLMGHPTQVVGDYIKNAIAFGTYGYVYNSGGLGGVYGATDNGYYNPALNTITYDSTGDDYGTIQEYQYISDFRGLATIFYSGLVCSNNPYPKAWAMRVRRAVQGWDANGCWHPELAIIAFSNPNYASGSEVRGMNPAHILYQCITDAAWGRGLDRAEMDDAGWLYAAQFLYDEKFGLCLRWSKDGDLDEFIQQVVDHIQAAIFVDRNTGLLTIRLFRDDYNPADLPVFSYNSGLLSVDTSETTSTIATTNEVIIKYFDPITKTPQETRVQNLSATQALGATLSETKEYPGIAWQPLAQLVGQRELMLNSAGLKRLKVKMDRRAWRLQPGSVFILSAPDKGITSLICRVATYDDGTAVDGTIKMDLLQDVFGMPYTAFNQVVQSTWTGSFNTLPPVIRNRQVYEASYLDMIRGLPANEFNSVTSDEGGVIALAQRPIGNCISDILWVTPEGGSAYAAGVGEFCPAGFVAVGTGTYPGLDYYDTTLNLTGGTELANVIVGTSALVGTEIVRVDAINTVTGQVTIARGCADTIPARHLPASQVFFSDSTLCGFTNAPFAVGETIGVQLLSQMTSSQLDPSLAPTDTITIVGRFSKPYPPADLKINGTLALSASPWVVTGNVVFTWVDRNAVTQADQVIAHTDGPVSPPSGLTYSVDVYNTATGALIRSHTGLTSSSGYTYTSTEAAGTGTADPAAVTFQIYSMLGGVASYEAYVVNAIWTSTTPATGYGNGYSIAYSE